MIQINKYDNSYEVVLNGNTIDYFDTIIRAKLEKAFQLCQVIRARHYRKKLREFGNNIANEIGRQEDNVIACQICLQKVKELGYYYGI